STSQCSTDSDCAPFGPGYVCGADNACVSGKADPTAAPNAPPPAPALQPANTNVDGVDASTPATGATATSITISPAETSVAAGHTQQFSAAALDAQGQPAVTTPTLTWTVSGGGTISPSGLFTAANAAGGPFTVTATSGALSATAKLTVTLSTIRIG